MNASGSAADISKGYAHAHTIEQHSHGLAWLKLLYASLAIVALACAAILLTAPESQRSFLDSGDIAVHLYADSVDPPGTSTAAWLERDSLSYECVIRYGVANPYCGLVVKFKRASHKVAEYRDAYTFTEATAIDLSRFETIRVVLNYEGPNEALNVFLRNGPLPQTIAEYERLTYVRAAFNTKKKMVEVRLKDFHPANWWLDRYKPAVSQLEQPLNSVVEVGIDMPGQPQAGTHRFRLQSIAAVRPLLPPAMVAYVGSAALLLLIVTITSQVVWRNFVRPYREENRTLRDAINEDRLTGCLNRAGLDTVINGLFPISHQPTLYILVMDLDHFKTINDTYGHAIGDEVLQQSAEALSQQLRQEDILGRWGGEEFILLTRLVTADGVETLVHRLMHALSRLTFDADNHTFSVTMSMGVTRAEFGEPFLEAFNRADNAMYEAKKAGRNTYRMLYKR